MKISAALVVVATTLGLVSAAPIRLVAVSSGLSNGTPDLSNYKEIQYHEINSFSAPRLGHTAAAPVPSVQTWTGTEPSSSIHKTASGCGGIRAKMERIGSKWRQFFGMPQILYGTTKSRTAIPVGEYRILPVVEPSMAHRQGDVVMTMDVPVGVGVAVRHSLHYAGRYRHDSFLARLHRALNQLGPWEGRAMAFVIGCGLGVLLRMFFVLAVVLIRSHRSTSSESSAGPIRLSSDDAAPPQYLDEKEVPAYTLLEEGTEHAAEMEPENETKKNPEIEML